ncbi:MAG: ribose-phosphate pyrophosphokinase-like domain-containing protein [Candidatus Scalindua sp.]
MIDKRIEATINLHKGFGQYGWELEVAKGIFSTGERHIEIKGFKVANSVRINSRFEDNNDLINILLTIDALKRRGTEYVELFLPYFPYTIQNRECDTKTPFPLKIVSDMFIASEVNRIITYDTRDIIEILLDKIIINLSNSKEVMDFIIDHEELRQPLVDYIGFKKPLVLICPDVKAFKKTQKLYEELPGVFKTIVYCHKKRLPSGGLLVSKINVDIKDMNCLVVGDICDSGATFLQIGDRLREAQVNQSYLFVSHGIFSKGTADLLQRYRVIGTTNSIYEYGVEVEGTKTFKISI